MSSYIVSHLQPGAGDTLPYQGDLTIRTGYLLKVTDQWSGIARNNKALLHTAYVTLAYINSEDDIGGAFVVTSTGILRRVPTK